MLFVENLKQDITNYLASVFTLHYHIIVLNNMAKVYFNSLPEDKILDSYKLKQLTGDIL